MALECSQLHKKPYNLVVCEFGGIENVLRDAGVRASPIHNVYRRYDTLEECSNEECNERNIIA